MATLPLRGQNPQTASADVEIDMTAAAKDAVKFLKSTLRLPSSTFPPRPLPADLKQYLPRCTNDLYVWQRENRPAEHTFRLHDGPPYANGDLHVGHALNKILKDIICRSKLAQGYRVDYTPGWDCHGLPIELKALEKHGWRRSQDTEPVAIRDAARAFAQQAVEKQMQGFKSWAVMGDWEHHWKTMDKEFEIRQLKVFQVMVKKGLIYRKNKPVFWSPSSSTALAEAELEYMDDHISQAAYIKFRLIKYTWDTQPVHALIWTTTPWTLPANQAIAINRNLQYALVRSAKHGILIVASTRLEHLNNILNEELEILDEKLDNETLMHSTYDGLAQFGAQATGRPIIHADFVSAEGGTGLVHCAPGHGMEDYLALKSLIQSDRVVVRAPVDAAGFFDESASPDEPSLLKGQHIFTEGNGTVLSLLEKDDLLVHSHQYRHKYPIDWRTKEPVIIRATAQWFADLSDIKGLALEAIEQVNFMPESGKPRLRSFVENRTEWCISRQRAWGVPIPAIYHVVTGEAVLDDDSVSHIIRVIQDRGIDAWWSDAADEPAWMPPTLNASDYRRGKDTMDVWFDSGTSWTSMAGHVTKLEKPLADIYIEGTDQHRGWFQSSLLTHTAYQTALAPSQQCHPPFASLITHGFTLDAQGKKMSKSLGNVINPDEIIKGFASTNAVSRPATSSKKYREKQPLGPDALRLWVASSDRTTDVVISGNVVKTVHTALDKYRVTFKMLLGMFRDFEPDKVIAYDQLSKLDQIALLQLAKTSGAVQHSLATFEFHKAVTAINRYVVADLSGFYFEAIKDIAYCDSVYTPRRLSLCTTLHSILSQLQIMLAPITPLLAQETWEHSQTSTKGLEPSKRTLSEVPSEWLDTNIEKSLPTIMAVNSSVKQAQEEARAQKLLGQSLASDVFVWIQPEGGISAFPVETWKEILVVSEAVIEERTNIEEEDMIEEHHLQNRAWLRTADIHNAAGACIGKVVVTSPTKEKCARCWRYVAIPTAEEQHPLCGRCTEVVEAFQA